mgnify:CR=1 FL=1
MRGLGWRETHPVVVVEPEDSRDVRGDRLVAGRTGDEGAGDQFVTEQGDSRVHVDVVGGKVEGDEEHDQEGVLRIGA